jgi:hypothetical protein
MTNDTTPAFADRTIARVGSYEELAAVCRAQVQSLGINYGILDVVAGFADGFIRKIGPLGGLASGEARNATASRKKHPSRINRRNALRRWHRAKPAADPQIPGLFSPG